MPTGNGPAVVLYRNAHLFNGAGEPVFRRGAILTDDARIVAVGDESGFPSRLRSLAVTVDLAGQYLLPGLVDSHQHLATPPNRAFAEAQLERDLFGGITTVRVMADDLRSIAELSRASSAFDITAPDLRFAALFAGPSFYDDPRVIAASHGYSPGTAPWMQAVTASTDLREAVTLARGTGASAVKIYANLDKELVERITVETRRQGLQVWAHGAVFPATPLDVVRAGVHGVSHARLLAYEGQQPVPDQYHDRAPVDVGRFSDSIPSAVRAVLEEMRDRGTVLDATLLLDRQEGTPPATLPVAAAIVRQARELGVRISAGTDAYASPEDPFPSLYTELELLVEHAGFTAVDALVAATAGGAAALGEEESLGILASGKLANFMITSEDPTNDVRALRSLTATVKRGRLFDRREFDPNRDVAARTEES
jgi:imidazolonepropionase-like amidohydrolase